MNHQEHLVINDFSRMNFHEWLLIPPLIYPSTLLELLVRDHTL